MLNYSLLLSNPDYNYFKEELLFKPWCHTVCNWKLWGGKQTAIKPHQNRSNSIRTNKPTQLSRAFL
jgi:hypothetical protein